MKILKSIASTLPMILVSWLLLLSRIPDNTPLFISNIIIFFIMNILFFLMIYTGKTYKYRAIIFISAALLFPIGFIYNNIIERGSMLVSLSTIYECKVPFCHIVTPMLLIPVVVLKEIPFPGAIVSSSNSIASMLVILFSAVIVIGRGWCSWGCFYGGWDEFFSNLRKKPVYYLTNVFWKYLPWAVMIFVILMASYTLTPVYCSWLCPFKPVTEFKGISTLTDIIQAVIFFSMFFIFIIILPLLTKKRAQCSCFCPLGPTIISFLNRFNLYDVTINKTICVNCKKCIKICPLMAIDDESLKKGKTLFNCAKCSKCIDECPKKAISFHIKGTKIDVNQSAQRLLYLYSSWTLMTALLGGILSSSITVILKLVFHM